MTLRPGCVYWRGDPGVGWVVWGRPARVVVVPPEGGVNGRGIGNGHRNCMDRHHRVVAWTAVFFLQFFGIFPRLRESRIEAIEWFTLSACSRGASLPESGSTPCDTAVGRLGVAGPSRGGRVRASSGLQSRPGQIIHVQSFFPKQPHIQFSSLQSLTQSPVELLSWQQSN